MSQKLNIAFLIPRLNYGGAERVVSRLSHLLENDYNIIIILFDGSQIGYSYAGTLYCLDAQSKKKRENILSSLQTNITRIKKLKKLKKELNIDITYSFGDKANLINVLSNGNDKKITSIRGYKRLIEGNSGANRPIKLVHKLIYRKSDHIVAVSNLIRDSVIRYYNINQDKISTIYNGYDLESIKELGSEVLNCDEQKLLVNPYIVTVGTFRYEKGYWNLIKAFALVNKVHPNLDLLIIGQDYQNNKEKVKKIVNNFKLNNNVHLIGYQKNPFKFISKSTIYVLSSVLEGFPNALVEAMSLGIPVVAFDCPSGPREIFSTSSRQRSPSASNFAKLEYGIIAKEPIRKESYNSNLDEDAMSLSNAILDMMKENNLQYYKKQSEQRAKDFSYDRWKIQHQELFNFVMGLKNR